LGGSIIKIASRRRMEKAAELAVAELVKQGWKQQP
jgi:hypothetical protein